MGGFRMYPPGMGLLQSRSHVVVCVTVVRAVFETSLGLKITNYI